MLEAQHFALTPCTAITCWLTHASMAMLVDNNVNIYFPRFSIRKASVFLKAVTDSGDLWIPLFLDSGIVFINKSILYGWNHIVFSRPELIKHIEYLLGLALISL